MTNVRHLARRRGSLVSDGRSERRLTAILAADVAGYARMLAADEARTLAQFTAHVSEALAPTVVRHGGRIVKTMGDGVLAEFPSTVAALVCAVEFQQAMAERNRSAPAPMSFRVGVNAGDVVCEGGDVFGDAVNVAARIEAIAPPGGVCVSERVREDALGRVDFAFEDAGPQKLKNIDRPVRVFRVQIDGLAPQRPALALPDKPSVAVLPFDNLSGDPTQEYFADGVTEDIITALSRWRWFFVIARNSSFIYRGRAVDVRQVGRELGVRYVLEGSVRKSGERVRVAAQLIDATDATHIWSDTFDRDLTNLFAMSDEITRDVVNAIEPAMQHTEGARVGRSNIRDLSAFDCFQRGMWHLNMVTAEDCDHAEQLFRETIRRDPELSLGHIGLSRILYGKVIYGWSANSDADIAEARAAAETAVRLDPRDSWARQAHSGALLFLGLHEEALDEAQAAISLNPNCGLGHARLGQALVYAGRPAEAAVVILRAMRHNPYDPQIGAHLTILALAYFHAGQYEDAARRAQAALAHNDLRAAGIEAASLARLGRVDEARRKFTPDVQARAAKTVRRIVPYRRPEDFLDLLDALRLAGLGEPILADLGSASAEA